MSSFLSFKLSFHHLILLSSQKFLHLCQLLLFMNEFLQFLSIFLHFFQCRLPFSPQIQIFLLAGSFYSSFVLIPFLVYAHTHYHQVLLRLLFCTFFVDCHSFCESFYSLPNFSLTLPNLSLLSQYAGLSRRHSSVSLSSLYQLCLLLPQRLRLFPQLLLILLCCCAIKLKNSTREENRSRMLMMMLL